MSQVDLDMLIVASTPEDLLQAITKKIEDTKSE